RPSGAAASRPAPRGSTFVVSVKGGCMRRLVGESRKGWIGLVLAILLATGARSYAGSGSSCTVSCSGCSVTVTNCSGGCSGSSDGTNCEVSADGGDGASCGCDGSGGSCYVY